jgi:hypothetical protein
MAVQALLTVDLATITLQLGLAPCMTTQVRQVHVRLAIMVLELLEQLNSLAIK